MVNDSTGEVRSAAAGALWRLGDDRAVKPLLASVQAHGGGWEQTIALAHLGGATVVEPLIELLKSDNPVVVKTAADTLGRIRDPRAVRPLIALLGRKQASIFDWLTWMAHLFLAPDRFPEPWGHPDKEVRRSVARALSQIPSREAAEALVVFIEDEDLQRDAISALHRLDSDRAIGLCIRISQRSAKWWIHEAVIIALERIGGAQVVPVLIGILRDETYQRRYQAAIALGRIGDDRAIEPLIWTLREDDLTHPRADIWAARALGRMRVQRALPVLLETLQEAVDNNDVMAISALAGVMAKFGDRNAVPLLLEALTFDGSEYSRNYTLPEVMYALGKLGDARATESLLPLLRDISWMIRRAAASALGKIGDPRAVEGLLGCLDDEDHEVRRLALLSLCRIGDAGATEAMIGALRDGNHQLRKTAAQGLAKAGSAALPALLAITFDADWQAPARRRVAWLLAEIGDATAVDKLITVAEQDNDPRTRSCAVWALGQIGNMRGVDCLVKALDDSAPGVRAAAAVALGRLGQTQVVDHLAALRKDRDVNVRRAAAYALAKLSPPGDTG
jgi:HEAT repeat protein